MFRRGFGPTLIEMAHYLGDGTRIGHPRGEHLLAWGTVGLGIDALEGENKLDYLHRVFGVEDAVVAKGGGGFRPLTESDG